MSAILHVFVVMGRQARQLVPFFCLATAAASAELLERRRWSAWAVSACVVALVLQVAWNIRQPLQQRFPRDVIAEITTKYGPIDFENSIEGPPLTHEHVESRWVLLNAQHLYNPRAPRPPLPPRSSKSCVSRTRCSTFRISTKGCGQWSASCSAATTSRCGSSTSAPPSIGCHSRTPAAMEC